MCKLVGLSAQNANDRMAYELYQKTLIEKKAPGRPRLKRAKSVKRNMQELCAGSPWQFFGTQF